MSDKKHTALLILARGGSKGIRLKNLAPIEGKPLLEITLNEIKATKYINSIWVSTDHKDIVSVADKGNLHLFRNVFLICFRKLRQYEISFLSLFISIALELHGSAADSTYLVGSFDLKDWLARLHNPMKKVLFNRLDYHIFMFLRNADSVHGVALTPSSRDQRYLKVKFVKQQ